MKIALAMDYAHGCGVLHRILNPSHVMIDEHDRPQIFGFESALELDPIRTTAQSELTVRGAAYLSPEQVLGNQCPIGPASDIYASGAILYDLLTGRPPFSANSVPEILHKW